MYKMRRWSTRHAQILHNIYVNDEKTRKGCSMIMQISCRDRNRIAIQRGVLGASAMGVSV